MNKSELYNKMKEIIGYSELTHDVLDEYIYSGGWWERKMLPWEHCSMRFQEVYGPMNRASLLNGIYRCDYYKKSFYFGIGLKEPSVSDDMLKNGKWFVYSYSD